MKPRLEFFYEFASTYSYPAAMRVERVAGAGGVEVVWRPFLLGPLFVGRGLPPSPFDVDPAKGRYMWRDLARTCAAEGLAWKRPSVFPRRGLLAARVALVGADEGWIAPFSRAVFDANFARDQAIEHPAVLAPLIAAAGGDPQAAFAAATTAPVKDRLRAQGERAVALGLFGAPTLVAGDGELFWGNDRLEQAVAWAAQRMETA